jgi:hypothetical protein
MQSIFTCLRKVKEGGFGSVLSLDIATTQVKRMSNLAIASGLRPSSFQAIFLIGPPSAHPYILPGPMQGPIQGPTQQGPITASTNTSRSSHDGGRPKKAQRKATPLYALTLKNVEYLKGTNKKQVHDYAYQTDKQKPKDFDVCLSKVKKHIREQNREKAQQNHKKKSNMEVPPKSTCYIA